MKRTLNKGPKSLPSDDTDCAVGESGPSASENRHKERKKLKTSHQQSSSSSEPPMPNYDSYPGVIKSINLQNFMCHTNFTHDFHPNLNFITGQNGSGKSALLSGLLIALGGKATSTSRTSSVKSLIQKGKSSCRVSVTLINRNGLTKYGNEITIEKWISASGGSGYRVKSDGGTYPNQWKQIKKQELDNITCGLNIQIENPVAILNQEVARSFLRSKDPKSKFKLFYDGTQLGTLENIIGEVEENLEITETVLSEQREIIETIRQEVYQLKRKCQKITELNKLRGEMKGVHFEYLWSLVAEQETLLVEFKNKVDNADKGMEALSQKLNEVKETFSTHNAESILLQQSNTREKLRTKQEECNDVKKKFSQLKSSYQQLRMKLKTAASTVAAKEVQLGKLNAQIEKVKAEQDARERAESVKEQDHLNELRTLQKELEGKRGSIQRDADSFRLAADKEHDKLDNINISARGITGQIEAKKRGIQNLSQSANKYAVFGTQMEQLVAKIQANRHKFRKPPKGPIGACFRVRDPAYAVLVEGILGGQLRSFVVDNSMDLNLLREYVNSVYDSRGSAKGQKRPTIILTPFADEVYNYAHKMASHRDAHTLLQMLQIENDDHVILNALIDVEDIEKKLLFKDNTSASKVMKNEAICPQGVKLGYTLQWYKFTPAPNYAARVMPIKKRAEIIKSGRSREVEIESLKEEIEGLKQELKNLDFQKAEIKEQEKTLRLTHDEKVNELTAISRQIGEIGNNIKRQQNKIAQLNRRCDLTSYYEELQELQEDIAAQTAIRDQTTNDLSELDPNYKELGAEKKQLDDEIENLNSELVKYDEELEHLQSKRAEVETVINRLTSRMSSLKTEKIGYIKDWEIQKKAVADKKSFAVEGGAKERIKTNKTPDQLKSEFDSIKERILETESQVGNEDQLRTRLAERKEKFKGYMKQYTPLSNLYKILRQLNKDQKTSCENLKEHIGSTLTTFFSAMAKSRGYEGRLLVDFHTKELYYFVCPDGHSQSKTVKAIDVQQAQSSSRRDGGQLKQDRLLKKTLIEYSLGLSGGERSFSTICFILALWQVMECPFYMLDEFDVFMDAINRKTSQVALMAHAKKFDKNQFVLFTPLDLGEIPGEDEARVLRMFPPVRGNIAGTSGGRARQSDSSVENVDPMEEDENTNVSSVKKHGKGNSQEAGRRVLGSRTREQ